MPLARRSGCTCTLKTMIKTIPATKGGNAIPADDTAVDNPRPATRLGVAIEAMAAGNGAITTDSATPMIVSSRVGPMAAPMSELTGWPVK